MKTKSPPRPARSAPRKSPSRPVKAGAGIAAKLIRIGNSRGVRLPKAIIEAAGLAADIELRVEDGLLTIRSAERKHPREGWEEQMRKAVAEHGNELTEEDREWLDAPLNTEFDEKEWTW